MNFLYPDRPTHKMLAENLKKVFEQMERLDVRYEHFPEYEEISVQTYGVTIQPFKNNIPDKPTFFMHLMLFALAWQALLAKEESKIYPMILRWRAAFIRRRRRAYG